MNAQSIRAGAALGLLGLLLVPASAQSLPSPWVGRFDGPAHYDDFATAGSVLSSGRVVVAGTTWWEPQPGYFVPKFFTAAYSPQGVELWSQLYGSGYYGGNGAATVLAVAPGDRVVVSGQRNLGSDWVTLQYDADGALLWETDLARGVVVRLLARRHRGRRRRKRLPCAARSASADRAGRW